MKLWSSRVALQTCRRGGMGVWRRVAGVVTWRRGDTEAGTPGPLEAHCRRVEVEVPSSGGMERTAGVETWRNGGTERRTRVDAEARGSGGALPCVQTWRHGVMELWGSTVGVETGS